MKKEQILKQTNVDLLCQLGSEFLKGLSRVGIDIISVSDTELKRVISKMITDNDEAIQLAKDRLKESKRLQKNA